MQANKKQTITDESSRDESLEGFPIMQLAETGFAEWNDPEEDIYNDV